MIAWAVERMIGLLGPIAELQKDRREVADAALRAVSEALAETCLYCDALESGNATKETEAKLVRAWAAAAIPMRHIDPEFSQMCEIKSQYWINPTWPKPEIERVGIDLESVRKRYRALLSPKAGA